MTPDGALQAVHSHVEAPCAPGPIDEVEAKLLARGAEYQDWGEQLSFTPLRHRFTPGMYIREITMPAGSVITTKIHRTEHPYVLSKGRCLVLVEGTCWEELRAPHSGITYPGTRRLLFVLEETVWTTFHVNATDTRDIAELEKQLALDYVNPLLAPYVEERRERKAQMVAAFAGDGR